MHFTQPSPKQPIMSPVHWAGSLPKQVLLTMQASAILLFAVCLQASAASYSQTVSFTGKDVPLKTVFASIKKQTGYGVFYQNGEAATLEGTGNVTLDLKNVTLDLFLQVCLRNQPLEYNVEGTTIFIKKKEARSISVEISPGQPVAEIKGRVTNDKGEPLVNANVVVKRSGRGTVTDANGGFTLHNVSSEDVISVTFIGYKAQTVPLRDRTSLALIMEPATNELDKMVVQAYGQTSQRLATGNIGVVRAEDIAKQPVMNPLEAIQGQDPGTVVTSTSGFASGTIKVEIRGRNVIGNFPSDPLYIIDGVPLTILDLQNNDSYSNGSQGVIQSGIPSPAIGQSPFFSINPSDIESIEVLKDADATAIYGSRGSNGVILITTKKAKPGKAHFNFNFYEGASHIIRSYPLLNTHQYVEMRREALANDGIPLDINNAPDLIAWDTTRYTDWQKYLWGGTGKTTDAQASLSAGDSRISIRIGAGYHRQTELFTASGASQRGSLSFSLNYKSQDQKFNMALSGFYSIATSDMISLQGQATLPPNAPPIFDKLGNLNYAGWTPLNGVFPFGNLLNPYTTKTNFLNSNLIIDYELLQGLRFKVNLGYNNILTTQTLLTTIASQDPVTNPTGSSFLGYSNPHNVIGEPQLEYNRFIAAGKFDFLLGTSYQSNMTSSALLSGEGYTNDALLTSINNAPYQSASNFMSEYKYEAVFGRINYNWKDKYIISLNARRDGSSKFGPNRQFGNFGSVGGAWIFSEEKLIKDYAGFLSFGKIRASYGTTGGDQVGDYAYLSRWSFQNRFYNSSQTLSPLGHTDSTYHWQTNKKLEIALNLGFFKDRLTIEAALYRNRCNDQLIPFPTPVFTGFTYVTTNSPANVENKGMEFILNAKLIDSKKIKWSSKFNIGFNKNKLLYYPNLSQSPYASSYIIGQSLNIVKVLQYVRVDPQMGLYTFEDKNKDGQITVDYSGKSDDRYPIDVSPKFQGGITTDISYKNWQLSIFFYFKKQIGQNASISLDVPGDRTNQPTSVLSRWQKPGDITNVARFTTQGPSYDPSFANYLYYSDIHYTDASFVRLQNISCSYIWKKSNIGAFKIFVEGQNIFIITKYKGIDPEVQNFGGLPKARVITAGISYSL